MQERLKDLDARDPVLADLVRAKMGLPAKHTRGAADHPTGPEDPAPVPAEPEPTPPPAPPLPRRPTRQPVPAAEFRTAPGPAESGE